MKAPLNARALLVVALCIAPVVAFAQSQQATTSYAYDANGNLVQVTDGLSRSTTRSYDALNRLSQLQQPAPIAGAARPVIKFAYDGLGQTVSVTDPRNLATLYDVNGFGNVVQLTSPDTARTASTFDAAGNLISRTDGRGKVTRYRYDALDRLLRADYASGVPTVFEYDGGASGVPSAIGHLSGMSDESGQTSYTYDGFGRVIDKRQSVVAVGATSASYTVSYAWSAGGKLASVTYPSGNRVNYTYNSAGRINAITLNRAGVASELALLKAIDYQPFGAVRSWHWGNDSDLQPNRYARTFDVDGRVVTYPLGNPASTGLLRTVNYDAADRIVQVAHAGAQSPALFDQSFRYDDLDRLTGATAGNRILAFTYDASGNRIQSQLGTSTYSNTIDGNSNRLLRTTGPYPAQSNTFDGAGNLTADGTIVYTYSDRGRLSQINNGGVTVSYLYNGLGQRVSKRGAMLPGGAVHYVYDEDGKLLGEYGGDGVALQETVYLDQMPVAVLKGAANGATADVYYVYPDHLNTARVITRASDNAIVWRWDMSDPFGVSQPLEDPSGAGVFTYNPRFPGQVFDRETNRHYNYYRDYDPQTGRYIQSDLIGLEGGINTYGYVGGNPLSRVDPFGLLDATAVSLTTRIILQAAPQASAGFALGPLAVGVVAMCMPGNNGGQCADDPSYSRPECRKQKDEQDCEAIRKQIRDLEAQLGKKRGDLAKDQYDLYNRAYGLGSNPGGDIAKKGTFEGHVNRIVDLQVGLNRLIEKAKKMGCL